MHIEQLLSKFPCRMSHETSLCIVCLVHEWYLSQYQSLLCCFRYMWDVAYSFLIMTGPHEIGEPIFVQAVANDTMELETIATLTTNNVGDYNIADEHRCCPSPERDGQLEEVVVLMSFFGQLYQSLV